MSVREYIGARYVPVFAEPAEWDATKTYEPLTVVMYQGSSYTSRQAVPANISIENETYWALTGNYNAQIEQYRQEVAVFDQRITQNANDIDTLEAKLPTASFSSTNTVKKYVDDNITTLRNSTNTSIGNLDTSLSNLSTTVDNIDSVLPSLLIAKQSNIMFGSVVAKIPTWSGAWTYTNLTSNASYNTGVQGCCLGSNGAYVLCSSGSNAGENNVTIRSCINGIINTPVNRPLGHGNCITYDGTYYYVTSANNQIVKMDSSFNIITNISKPSGEYQPAYDKATNTLYLIPSSNINTICIYDASTNTYSDTGIKLEYNYSDMGTPQGVGVYNGKAVFPIGSGGTYAQEGLVVYDLSTGRLERNFTIYTDLFGTYLGELEDIDFDSNGNMYLFSAILSEYGYNTAMLVGVIKVALFSNVPIINNLNNFVYGRRRLPIKMSIDFNTYSTDETCTSLQEAALQWRSSNANMRDTFIEFMSNIYNIGGGYFDSFIGSIYTNGYKLYGTTQFRECHIDFRDDLTIGNVGSDANNLNGTGRNTKMSLRSTTLNFMNINVEQPYGRLADIDEGVCGLQYISSNVTTIGGNGARTLNVGVYA